LAAFVPCLGATYIGAAIFVVLVDVWSVMHLGILLLPNLVFTVIIAVISPLTCILSVEASVIISSRVSDVRAAQQLGGLVVLPLILVVVFAESQAEISPVPLSLIVSGILGIAVIALFYLSKATFKREEILTSWK